MRATLIAALFASGALSAPSLKQHEHLHRRQAVDEVVDTVTATATAVVTDVQTDVATAVATPAAAVVTPAAAPAAAAPAAAAAAPAAQLDNDASSAASSAAAPAASSVGSSDPFIQAMLTSHNQHRANNSASPLTWNSDLASAAQMLSSTCNFAHNTGLGIGGYGQNIAAASGGNTPAECANQVSAGWYNGEINAYEGIYGSANPPSSIFDNVGHYTQMVWQGTQQVGCASTSCGSVAGFSGTYLVCNYLPAGNIDGEYAQNVAQPLGNPTITGI